MTHVVSGVNLTEKDEEILWEEVRMGMLRDIVDGTAAKLRGGGLSEQEVDFFLRSTRHRALALFPDKEDVYDLIYAPRFQRIIEETRR